MNKKITAIFISIVFLFSLAIPCVGVLAQSTESCIQPASRIKKMQLDNWPPAPIGNYTIDTDSKLPQLIGYFFGWGVGLGGLAVFIALIIAGVQYITSIADPGKVKDARDRIKSAMIGLVLLLSSWAIFQLINPNLTNLTELKTISSKNGVISDLSKACEVKNDCCQMDDPKCDTSALDPGAKCPQVTNPACNPKYWACCQQNDVYCLKKGEAINKRGIGESCIGTSDCLSSYCQQDLLNPETSKCAQGNKGAGAECTDNSECACASADNCYYCKWATGKCVKKGADNEECNQNEDCINGKCACDRSDWKKKCAPNPKICNMVFEQQELGCDVVRFYQNPDFGGKYVDFKATWMQYTTNNNTTVSLNNAGDLSINTDWTIWKNTWPSGWSNVPQSYQAFSYQKDGHDNVVLDSSGKPILLACGELACGCSITRCVTANTSNECLEDTTDKSSGAFLEYAYNTNTAVLGVRVKDPTKQNWAEKALDLGNQVKGIGSDILCALTGRGCN